MNSMLSDNALVKVKGQGYQPQGPNDGLWLLLGSFPGKWLGYHGAKA